MTAPDVVERLEELRVNAYPKARETLSAAIDLIVEHVPGAAGCGCEPDWDWDDDRWRRVPCVHERKERDDE